ncbi:MAG: nuclear transport factor 2 family protein [Gemmatimonadota bacterium]|nr:nuclear transport factor 2 family protein [Gemmatimonadota bacterium]
MPVLDRPGVTTIVRGLQEQWMAAWRDKDSATLERILAPEFALTISASPAQSFPRDAWLRTASSGYDCTEFSYRDMQVRDFGDIVIVSSVFRVRATAFGVDRSGEFFLTDVWRPGRESEWQVIARYSSVPEPSNPSSRAINNAGTLTTLGS